MVVIAVVYARNDCQHPTAAKRSEQPQDCVPGLLVWLDNLSLQDAKSSEVSGGPRCMMEDSQRFLSLPGERRTTGRLLAGGVLHL